MPEDYSRGAVAAGLRHSLALMRDGTVWTWGTNERAQLGYGERWKAGNTREVVIGSAPSPQRRSVTGLRAVAAGDEFTLGLRQDGTVWGWGSKTHGQLGDGTQTPRSTPVSVLTGVTQAAGGRIHSAAIKADGTLWTWGSNSEGRLGDSTYLLRTTPQAVPGVPRMQAVALAQHTLAIGLDGSLWSWGENSRGQLGDGTTISRSTGMEVFPADTVGRGLPVSEEISYVHTDAIGSVRMITSATGTVLARYDYLPFGTEWTTSFSSLTNNLEFTGQERDPETAAGGWNAHDYFGARYHQSQTGRFLGVDPVVDIQNSVTDPQRWNRYTYVRNNPFRYVDPDGRQLTAATWFQRITANLQLIQGLSQHPLVRQAEAFSWTVGIKLADFLGRPTTQEALKGGIELVAGADAGPSLLPAISSSTINRAVSSAAEMGERQASIALRHLASHIDHGQKVFQGLAKTEATALGLIRAILQSPRTVTYGTKTFDVYDEYGRGVRLDTSTGKFVGYLDQTIATR